MQGKTVFRALEKVKGRLKVFRRPNVSNDENQGGQHSCAKAGCVRYRRRLRASSASSIMATLMASLSASWRGRSGMPSFFTMVAMRRSI